MASAGRWHLADTKPLKFLQIVGSCLVFARSETYAAPVTGPGDASLLDPLAFIQDSAAYPGGGQGNSDEEDDLSDLDDPDINDFGFEMLSSWRSPEVLEAMRHPRRRKRPPSTPSTVEESSIEMKKVGVGIQVWMHGVQQGRISYPIHWTPPCFCGICNWHDDCRISLEASEEAEGLLAAWLCRGGEVETREDHEELAPPTSRVRRRRP